MARKRRSSKSRKQSKVKLNWNNKTLEKVARYLLYSEGRLSKDQIIEIGNQTLFYRLKSGGYIEEVKNTDKGIFKTTDKLRSQYKTNIDANARWSGSGSTEHSKGVYNVINLLPENIIMEGKIQTEEFLKDEFKMFKRQEEYKTNLQNYKNKLNSDKMELVAKYNKDLKETPIDRQALLKASYDKKIEQIDYRLKVLNDNNRGISNPDFRVIASRDQTKEILENLRNERDNIDNANKIDRFNIAINKIENIISRVGATQEIQLNFEVITENYEARDIIAKENYEVITGQEMIYIPTY